jgi:hypothetical protein
MKTPRRMAPVYAAAALASVIAAMLALRLSNVLPCRLVYLMEIKAGNALIAKVEQFRVEHGRLPDEKKPDEVTALGFELRAGYHPDYRSMGTEYEIGYYFRFDGPNIIYSSTTKDWRCELY